MASTATLGPAGQIILNGANSRYVADAAVTVGDAAYATLNGDQPDTITGFPIGIGDGTTVAFTLHPTITTLSKVYVDGVEKTGA